MSNCQLEQHPEYGGCCCICKYRLRAIENKSVQQFAWACIAFALVEDEDMVFIGGFEHGLCELFTAIQQGETKGYHDVEEFYLD